MNSIESLRVDFNSQQRELSNVHNEKMFDDCIYVGSGDSFVAGLIAEYISGHKCKCYSPSDLFNSRFNENTTYCFVSVTGNTAANIKVAQNATKCGADTVAVTLTEHSQLAQVCKKTVPLQITSDQSAPAGFTSFAANVVTCLQLAGYVIPKKFELWQKKGIKMSLDLIESIVLPKDTLYILGNKSLYAVALYASLKMSEFFCAVAVPNKLEEFCHSPIFGIKQSDHIWIMGQKDEATRNSLRKLGIPLSYFDLYSQDTLTQLFVSVFFVQNLMLLLAKKYGYNQLQYPLRKEILKTSSDLIYGRR